MKKSNKQALHERYLYRRDNGLCADCGVPVDEINGHTGKLRYACNTCRVKRGDARGVIEPTMTVDEWIERAIKQIQSYMKKRKGTILCYCRKKSFKWEIVNNDVIGSCDKCGMVIDKL